jgi:ankyrin repeat protein
MKKIYIFLLFFYVSWLYTMDIEEKNRESLTETDDQLEESINRFVEESLCIPEQVSTFQLIEAVKNDNNNALELAQALPENDLKILLFKAARMFPLDRGYNGYPVGKELEEYRIWLKKFNNKFITHILFQPWAGPYIQALNTLKIWGELATERTLFRTLKKKDLSNRNRIAIITILLDNNTNVNTPLANKKSLTPLDKAIKMEHNEVVDLFLERNADIHQGIPLLIAAKNSNLAIATSLITHGVNVDLGDPLYTSVLKGNSSMVNLFLYNNAKIRETSLLIAIRRGFLEIAASLIKEGADVNYGNPLIMAIRKKYTDIATLLIEHGADIQKYNPLAVAAQRGLITLVPLLVEKGASVDIGNPLINAIKRKYTKLATLLINYGADVQENNPLLLMAQKGFSTSLASLLIDRGADVNLGNPLITAIQNGNIDIAFLLIERGADLASPDQEGLTPLSAVFKKKNLPPEEKKELIDLLLPNTARSSNTSTENINKTKRSRHHKRKRFEIAHVTFEEESVDNKIN